MVQHLGPVMMQGVPRATVINPKLKFGLLMVSFARVCVLISCVLVAIFGSFTLGVSLVLLYQSYFFANFHKAVWSQYGLYLQSKGLNEIQWEVAHLLTSIIMVCDSFRPSVRSCVTTSPVYYIHFSQYAHTMGSGRPQWAAGEFLIPLFFSLKTKDSLKNYVK